MPTISRIQIGKQGLTENFIESLRNNFKKHENVKISVLKSARENRKDMKRYAKEILEKLGKNYTAKIVGFTIAVKKWRKARM